MDDREGEEGRGGIEEERKGGKRSG